MQKSVEFIGKKVEEAVEAGLKELGIDIDDADIKILERGGLFKKAKVLITYDDGKTEEEVKAEEEAKKAAKAEEAKKEAPIDEPHFKDAPVKREPTLNPSFGKHEEASEEVPAPQPSQSKGGKGKGGKGKSEKAAKAVKDQKPQKPRQERPSAEPTEAQIETAKTFLSELLSKMNIEGQVEIKVEDGLRINIDTEDSRVIGHRGEVLDAFSQLVSTRINTTHGSFVHVSVDGLGYRGRRKETLESIARRMADKATRTHRRVALDAMNSADRRIIHATLAESETVFTRSEGSEPNRRVVIVPKRRS